MGARTFDVVLREPAVKMLRGGERLYRSVRIAAKPPAPKFVCSHNRLQIPLPVPDVCRRAGWTKPDSGRLRYCSADI